MSSIQKSLTTGVFYTAIAKYSNSVFSIIIGAVLARLLSPQEFGIVALVTVFVAFFRRFRIRQSCSSKSKIKEI